MSHPEVPEVPKNSFYRRGEHGFVELVDSETGVVIAVQETYGVLPRAEFIEATQNGRKVLIQSTINLPDNSLSPRHPFSQVLADVIVQRIVEGAELSKLHLIPGFPDRVTLARWRRDNPDFDKEIRFAKRMRAENLRDEMVRTVEAASGCVNEELGSYKLKVDTLKWLVEKENPVEYGNKVELSGNVGVTQIVIETGIRRPGDPGYKAREEVDITPAKEEIEEASTIDKVVGQ